MSHLPEVPARVELRDTQQEPHEFEDNGMGLCMVWVWQKGMQVRCNRMSHEAIHRD